MDKIQSEGNDYVYSDCYLRPEKPVNYMKRKAGGLEINHVRSKSMALFIRNLMEETENNIYLDTVVRKYCNDEDVIPVPIKPNYLDNRLITIIKLVLGRVDQFSTKNFYNTLLNNEFHITEDYKLRIELLYQDSCLQNILQFTNGKVLSLPVRSNMWKIIHRIKFTEIEEARVKLSNPSCKICGKEDIDRVHIYFECEKVHEIGEKFLQVLRVYDPQYTFTEILEFKGKEEHPQLYWFIALTLYYVDTNRRRGNFDQYRAFMWSELEILKLSKYADQEMLIAINIMLELLGD